MVFPPGNTETDNRVLVADLIPPTFATVLAIGDVFRTLVKAGKIWHLRTQVSTVQHADSQFWTEEKLQQQVLLINDGAIKAAEVVKQMEETAPARDVLSRNAPLSKFDCGKHGVWLYWGPSWQARQTLGSLLMDEPWNVVLQPPLACQTKSEWHRQRGAQRELRRDQLNETSDMATHDKEVRAAPERPKRQHVFNIHPEPGSVADYHSNRQLQAEQPFLYGPYLSGGESYQTPRTAENANKAACAAAGLDELPERHRSERDFYRDLIYELWILFDDKMRSIKGVEIDLGLDHAKPIRLPPRRLSPAKTEIAKALVQELVDDGLLKPVTSEWGFSIVIVLKPDGKAYRLCVDLRELNKIIPHDTYEPPTCGACLEWLAQRPFRSTGDFRWGFHQVLQSERMQKIMALNTPFGTFCYQR